MTFQESEQSAKAQETSPPWSSGLINDDVEMALNGHLADESIPWR